MPGSNIYARELTEGAVLGYLRKLAGEELELPPETVAQLGPETSLIGGLHLDSLAQAVLITQVEEHYGFFFKAEDRERLQTAETIRDFMQIILFRAQNREK